ncbi:MAG: RseA family anti-sigma factor [Burkholderiales bacterium]
MSEDISRLMDGELDDDAAVDRALATLKHDAGATTWACYHLIGDTMRGSAPLAPGFSRRFAAALAAEPTVLAPVRRVNHPVTLAWAAAATVAAVAVVGWTALSLTEAPDAAMAVAREATNVRAAEVRGPVIPADYLLAHQEYSPATAIQGVRPYARAVSYAAPAER